MDVKLIYSKFFGEVVGQVAENLDNKSYSITNPERLVETPQGMALMPLMDLVKRDKDGDVVINVKKDDLIFDTIYDVRDEVKKAYEDKHKKATVAVPEKKLYLPT